MGAMNYDNNRNERDRLDPEIFSAIITPHRSLGPRGFLIFMLCLGGLSFIAGVIFVSLGAWPVFGFFGLDVLLVYFAFRANYRSARAYELDGGIRPRARRLKVRVQAAAVTVCVPKLGPRG